jgi:hypothetical protein
MDDEENKRRKDKRKRPVRGYEDGEEKETTKDYPSSRFWLL